MNLRNSFAKQLTDLATGQEYAVIVAPIHQRRMGKWVRLFQDSKLRLMQQHPEVRGQAYQVLAYLEVVSTWTNSVPSAALTAQRLGLARATVAHAYAALLKAEFLLRSDGVYYLSPVIAWKGNQRQYEAACRELFEAQYEDQHRVRPTAMRALTAGSKGEKA